MTIDADRPSGGPVRVRHPIAVTIGTAVALAVFLVVLWLALPLSGAVDHAAGHLALAIPALALLALAIKYWPAATVRAETIARVVLLVGLAVLGCALTAEAIGAFGYDGHERINGLAEVHDLAVPVFPLGLVLVMAGGILSVGVHVARRAGKGASRYLTASVGLAIVAVVAFVAGGVIFGY